MKDRPAYLPRLAQGFYQGHASVHWTLTTADRRTGWLTAEFHHRFRELLLHTLARGHLVCPVYCLMPDHLHLIWMGLCAESDQMRSIAFLDTYLEPLLAPARLQPQPHDHVRAGLAQERAGWPYLGCMVPGYPQLHPLEDAYWPKFWRIHGKLKERSPA